MRASQRSMLIPSVSALLLVALLGLRIVERAPAGDLQRYKQTTAAEIRAIPFNFGPYFGVDEPVTPAAVELLQANETFQRRYTDLETGEGFTLMIVHCMVAKDMTGHYPPNCYPRSGWVADEPPEAVPLETDGVVIPSTLYHFEKQQGLTPQRMDILNFFVLPTGPQRFAADIRSVNQASTSVGTSQFGAAQVQIMTPREMTPERREAVWEAVLENISEALFVIAEGPA